MVAGCLGKTLASLQGMVEVRRLNNNDAMLIGARANLIVRENLRLRQVGAYLCCNTTVKCIKAI